MGKNPISVSLLTHGLIFFKIEKERATQFDFAGEESARLLEPCPANIRRENKD